MNWDDKSINGYLKGETFQVDNSNMKGSFTIKYVSVKCGNSVDVILDDDFSYKYYYRGDFEKVSNPIIQNYEKMYQKQFTAGKAGCHDSTGSTSSDGKIVGALQKHTARDRERIRG
jgi:hypothetical protein